MSLEESASFLSGYPKLGAVVNLGDEHSKGVVLAKIFPIREWTQAYEAYRYEVRIFAFSEYVDIAQAAAKSAMKQRLNISADSFYDTIRHDRN